MKSARGENIDERISVVSLHVTLEKTMGCDKSSAIDEVMNLLHLENFNMSLFKEIINTKRHCQDITQNVFEKFKVCWTYTSTEMEEDVLDAEVEILCSRFTSINIIIRVN